MEASLQHIKVEVDENLVVAFEEPIKQEPMKSAVQVYEIDLEEVGFAEQKPDVKNLDLVVFEHENSGFNRNLQESLKELEELKRKLKHVERFEKTLMSHVQF